jgi:hypothetical protein
MQLKSKALLAAAGLAAFAFSSPANAIEAGVLPQTKAGIFIGSSAGVPPPGIYMFNQVFTFQGNVAGPITSTAHIGTHNSFQAAVDIQGFVFVPGWTFLGATYDAVLVQPFVMQGVGNPLAANPVLLGGTSSQLSGVHNTYFVPVELSWKLGTSGFAVKTGLGIYAPDGTVTGVAGTGNAGNAFWTFQPEVIISYLANGWNLSAAIYEEFNTANTVDNYTTGNIFHADFTATKTIGKWTFGPVAYYYAQVSDDKCPIGVCTAINPLGTAANASRFHVFAVGGLVEYNFGPASLSVWATQEVLAKASNVNPITTAVFGGDTSLTAQGLTVLATLSYRLWAPEEPAKAPMFHK